MWVQFLWVVNFSLLSTYSISHKPMSVAALFFPPPGAHLLPRRCSLAYARSSTRCPLPRAATTLFSPSPLPPKPDGGVWAPASFGGRSTTPLHGMCPVHHPTTRSFEPTPPSCSRRKGKCDRVVAMWWGISRRRRRRGPDERDPPI
jgi:hypothetical protein